MASKSYTLLEYLVTIEMELKKLKKIVAESVGSDYSELISQINGIGQELNTFKSSITDTVNTNNSEITSKFNSLEQQFNTFKTSITNTVNTNNTSLLSKVNSLETQFNSFKTSITSTVNSNKSEILSQLNSLETEIDSRFTDVENRVTTLENSGGGSGAGVSDGYGEKLLAHYIHQGNPEFQFTSFNFTTCEGITTEPHGLSSAVEVIVVPNEWTLKDRKNGVETIPTEWVHYEGIIKLVPVDDVTLRVAKNDGTTLIPVDINADANQSVDYNKFHFEKVNTWSISNLPTITNYFRLIVKGYIKSHTNRYFSWKIKNSEGVETVQTYPTLNAVTVPSVNTPKPYNCLFGVMDIIFDFRDDLVQFDCKCYCEGRRSKLTNVVWDIAEEKKLYLNNKKGDGTGGLSYIGNYSDKYAFNSNGTHVYIYDLGGIL